MSRQEKHEKLLKKLQKNKPKAKQKKKPVKQEPVQEIKKTGLTLLEAIEEIDSRQPLVVLKRRYLKKAGSDGTGK